MSKVTATPTMKIERLTPGDSGFPECLKHIPQPPKELFVLGRPLAELLEQPTVAIVGSRKASGYGRAVSSQLAEELARHSIVIVSGLALGIDSIAHRGALDAQGVTVAVLPSCLDKIYPRSHYHLAKEIVQKGGALVSEYPPGTEPRRENFIARNRLIAALSGGVVITEAALKSGSLHTARFALEQGKEVMAVPGNITSELSTGTNNLIKAGAAPITCADDVLSALGLEALAQTKLPLAATNEQEQIILDLIAGGQNEGAKLLAASGLTPEVFNQTLTMLEITGRVRAIGGDTWDLR